MDETILALTERLIEQLQTDVDYRTIHHMDSLIACDEVLNVHIQTFQDTQKSYQDIQKYGSHHRDAAVVKARYIEAKTTVFAHPLVAARIQATTAFQAKLDQVTAQLAQAISPAVPYARRVPVHLKGGSSCSTEKASSSTSVTPKFSNI